jgi:hypothetical protein
MNTTLALIGSALVSEVATARGEAPLAAALSLICSIAAVLPTHGVAGRVQHGRDGWCFSQVGAAHFWWSGGDPGAHS